MSNWRIYLDAYLYVCVVCVCVCAHAYSMNHWLSAQFRSLLLKCWSITNYSFIRLWLRIQTDTDTHKLLHTHTDKHVNTTVQSETNVSIFLYFRMNTIYSLKVLVSTYYSHFKIVVFNLYFNFHFFLFTPSTRPLFPHLHSRCFCLLGNVIIIK